MLLPIFSGLYVIRCHYYIVFVVDVITHFLYMADVIAMVADGICHMYIWGLMFLPYM